MVGKLVHVSRYRVRSLDEFATCAVCGYPMDVGDAVFYDDGWKVGVLCPSCTEYAEAHPPDPDDYAYPRAVRQEALRDAVQEALGNDLDGMSSDYADFADPT